jgi:hypothetical protein
MRPSLKKILASRYRYVLTILPTLEKLLVCQSITAPSTVLVVYLSERLNEGLNL